MRQRRAQAGVVAEHLRDPEPLGFNRHTPEPPRATEVIRQALCGDGELEEVLKQGAEAVREFALLTLAQGRDLLDQVGNIQGVKLTSLQQGRLFLRPAIKVGVVEVAVATHVTCLPGSFSVRRCDTLGLPPVGAAGHRYPTLRRTRLSPIRMVRR